MELLTLSMEKIILGYWDGLPIWRYKTAAEQLAEELTRRQNLPKTKLNELYPDLWPNK